MKVRYLTAFLIGLVALTPTALGRSQYLSNAEAKYPGIVGTRIDSCTLCHNMPFDGSRNPYGVDLFNASFDFAAIESLDSDTDGASNINEINSLYFPGIQTDTPPAADTTPPVITILGSNPIHVAQGSVYADVGATASDNVDGDLTVAITVTGAVNTAIPGNYSIVYHVQDAAGNVSQAVRTIVVDPAGADVFPPVITILGSNPMHVAQGSVYADAGATATDNVDGDLTAAITVTGAVNTAVPGNYSIVYHVQDAAGNISEAARTVVVDAVNSGTGSGEVDLKARLLPVNVGDLESGHAEYESNSENSGEHDDSGHEGEDKSTVSESKLVVELENVYTADVVAIYLAGQLLGTADVEHGEARFALESSHGDTVPVVTEGAVLEVVRGGDQVLLLSGAFASGSQDGSEQHTRRHQADADHDGSFSFVDIQEVVLTALGEIQSVYNVDLDNNGVVDVNDVQLVLNAGCAIADHYFKFERVPGDHMEALLDPVSEPSAAHGKVQYEAHNDNYRLQLEVEGLTGISAIEITLDGAGMGALPVSNQHVEVKWDTRNGDLLPELYSGSVIEVQDAATHTVLLSGVFDSGPTDDSNYYLTFYNADINGNGHVDASDVLLVWAAALGRDIGGLNADVNTDGVVDQLDIDVVTLIAVLSSCTQSYDLDSDGGVGATDIQLAINSALGLPIGLIDADLDANGNVDAIDIQKIVRRALGM